VSLWQSLRGRKGQREKKGYDLSAQSQILFNGFYRLHHENSFEMNEVQGLGYVIVCLRGESHYEELSGN